MGHGQIGIRPPSYGEISANASAVWADRSNIPWHCESCVISVRMVSARFFLLRLTMWILLFCSTRPKTNREYDKHTRTFLTAFRLYSTLTDHYNQPAPSSSRYTRLVFHSNMSPGTMQAENGHSLWIIILCTPKNVLMIILLSCLFINSIRTYFLFQVYPGKGIQVSKIVWHVSSVGKV